VWVKLHTVLLSALALTTFASTLQDQSPSPSAMLAPGFAIVSGFSGAEPTGPSLPSGANPADRTDWQLASGLTLFSSQAP
jgi:hypothetical protein